MTDVELPTPAAAGGGGFPDAISRILSHTGVPRPKRIKREKQEESKPIIPLTTPGAEPNNGEDGDGNSAEVKPNTTEKSAARRKHLSVRRRSSQNRDSKYILVSVDRLIDWFDGVFVN